MRLMSSALLVLCLALASSYTLAASFVRTDGSVVEPILTTRGRVIPSSTTHLGPAASLSGADLSGADLSGADLYRVDLSTALLVRTNLLGARLSLAGLQQAKLFDADLSDAELKLADLTGADLTRATLNRADLVNANLTAADLNSAELIDAKLDLANLTGANLRRANLDGASLSGANLNGVIGLNRTFGVARYSATTDFSNTGFDPVAAGWSLVDDPSSHTSALLHVPEPTISILFAVGGLIGLLQAGNRASRQR